MRTRFWAIVGRMALLGGILIGGATWSCGQSQDAPIKKAGGQFKSVPKKVLTFYYGWYGNPEVSGRWVHWTDVDKKKQTIGNSTHYPELGAYDSHDPAVLEQHCRWARASSIDGFIVSWWRPNDFHDEGMPLLLKTAQKSGLEITAYFETVPNRTREQALEYVLYLLNRYGEDPAWLKLDGKPVLFVYGRAIGEIGLDQWEWVIAETRRQYAPGAVFIGDRLSRQAADIFDGIHTYNITGQTARRSPEEIRQWARQRFPEIVAIAPDRIVCLTIIPGYDDSKLDRPKPRPITDRHDGQTYSILWEEAIAANPAWILITSWNEWHEGSEIEPSIENGHRELDTTAKFAPQFRGQKIPSESLHLK